MKITIALVKPDELDALSCLAARTYCDAFGYSLDAEQLNNEITNGRSVDYFRKAIEKGNCILVAKNECKIVGYVQFGNVEIPEVNTSKSDMELSRLYVDTQLQGRGIGKQLIHAALNDKAMKEAANIYLQVWEENHIAIKLYERFGFEKCGVTVFDLGGTSAQDLIMVKQNR